MGDKPISEVVADNVSKSVVYPLWVVECHVDGFVCTVWEKPGTGCSYIENCPECGGSHISTTKVENKDEHEAAIERANANRVGV